jgi:hypothetical protein
LCEFRSEPRRLIASRPQTFCRDETHLVTPVEHKIRYDAPHRGTENLLGNTAPDLVEIVD